jgi:hypothetical protein
MGTKIRMLSILIMLLIGASLAPKQASAQGGYVWIPDAGPGFSPYSTNGYWVYTDQGWTWVSNYSWGWAPFHYGRWYFDNYYGYMWIPDDEWGPGWVTWRRSGDYYGWAPIGPGISINIAYSNNYYVPDNQWTFVRNRDFGRRNINNYYVNNSTNVTIINNSTVINNTYIDKSRNVTYNTGPDRAEVEKRVGKPVKPVAIKESSKPGQTLSKNQLQLYKPQVKKASTEGKNPAPSTVKTFEDVKPAAERSVRKSPNKANQPTKQQPPVKQQPDKSNKKATKAKQTKPAKNADTENPPH